MSVTKCKDCLLQTNITKQNTDYSQYWEKDHVDAGSYYSIWDKWLIPSCFNLTELISTIFTQCDIRQSVLREIHGRQSYITWHYMTDKIEKIWRVTNCCNTWHNYHDRTNTYSQKLFFWSKMLWSNVITLAMRITSLIVLSSVSDFKWAGQRKSEGHRV